MREIDDPEVLAVTSPEFVEVRVDHSMAYGEFVAAAAVRHTAELWGAIADVLSDAERHPNLFVNPHAVLTVSERRDYAVRSATADFAVRLHVAENTVRGWGEAAQTLRGAGPRVWAAFREGLVSVANARVVADLISTLPDAMQTPFADSVLDAATRLAPARFRAYARSAQERAQHEALADRHRRAAELRRVVVEDAGDGMSWLSIHLPTPTAHRAMTGITAAAHSLQGGDDKRTLDQLRADVAGDLLTGLPSGASVGVSVSVTVPVLTLLGHSDEPGVLQGAGPIDAETARRLAGEATSFHRILTHPVTGAVLALDRTTYRVPADLKRHLETRDRSCRFPGCGRSPDRCDVDHIVEWQHGGLTEDANLMHLCRHHHRLKSVAGWRAQAPDAGVSSDAITWISPTDQITEAHPPPF